MHLLNLFAGKAKPSSLAPGGPAAQPTFYHLQQTRQPHAGVLSYAYDNIWYDPVSQLLGAGTQVGGLRSLQGQPTLAQAATTQAGIGTVAGQYILQPLIDNGS